MKRALGVQLNGDVAERLCDMGLRPPLGPRRSRRLDLFRGRGLLFIHVPKAAGMAVSHALYGEQVQHATIRYYRAVALELTKGVPSLAVVRDPIDRFRSAYAYARAAGSRDNRVSEPFRSIYAAFRDVDEALDHLEAADWPYGVDHIFRPQAWYITDRQGAIAVDRLVALPDLKAALRTMAPWASPLPELNRTGSPKPRLNSRQEWRLRYLYAADLTLERTARLGGG
ncbi:MAG: hypothetical protein JNL41_07665 [Phenylobacterium sp.]|uniref:hypothetical protein n=1 Tax=Phenylobacterium sp. TaxID=1871053 RepID=UPI001A47F1CB|nr:hypothetical protein [Phenylobacterium sp.]MBL8554139.1 hypothetical protein [Phenylobacterium sp.]